MVDYRVYYDMIVHRCFFRRFENRYKENMMSFALNKIKELTELHASKKPINIVIDTILYDTKYCNCPNCNMAFIIDNGDCDWEYDYCPSCGQKLDWNEEVKKEVLS